MQMKRPPLIILRKQVETPHYDDEINTRLPGNQTMGHAYVWLFRLATSNYTELFNILNKHNLTARRFTSDLMKQLLSSLNDACENLLCIALFSSNTWIQNNQEKVNEFLEIRWPSYPFETKFEIMKLISKHIITVQELVLDENMGNILRQCSMSTLIACTGMDLYI